MADKNQYLEAKKALMISIDDIEKILIKLKSARRWGLFDLFTDSKLIAFFKRSKMGSINDDINRLKSNLSSTKNELIDINIDLEDELPDRTYDFFVDVIFDNPFTDFRVQRELKETADNLVYLRDYLEDKLNMVDKKLKEM